MGRHANARAWAEYEYRQQREQQKRDEAEPPLTEAERAADMAEWSEDRHDREVEMMRGGW